MRFLLTNDDGIRATGLAVLERVVTGLGDIHVVAPDPFFTTPSTSMTWT